MVNLMQRALAAWQERNFGQTGTCKPEWCLAGMVEELGELAHLLLKRRQGIRGVKEEAS